MAEDTILAITLILLSLAIQRSVEPPYTNLGPRLRLLAIATAVSRIQFICTRYAIATDFSQVRYTYGIIYPAEC